MSSVNLQVTGLLALALILPYTRATTYTVGDTVGWSTGVNYGTWKSNKSFFVGDKLEFSYSSSHSVIEVNKTEYDSCSTATPVAKYTSGQTKLTLNTNGQIYFICGTPNHCSEGMKLDINVVAAGNPVSPPPPATRSSSPTPPGLTISSPPPPGTNNTSPNTGGVQIYNVGNADGWNAGVDYAKWLSAIGVLSGIFGVSTIILIYIRINQKKRQQQEEERDIRGYMDPLDCRYPSIENFLHAGIPTRYSYHQIKRYTNNFVVRLGQGGFGTVFKGELPNGCMVAVKILDKSKHSRIQFMNEAATIGRIHHLHLVRLLGYCFENSKRALIYEYMVNGSLEKYIHGDDRNILDWKQLYSIAMGTARGIAYLHDDCRSMILHCDFKPHNILLDGNFSPKVADFGLAKLTDREESHVSLTGARGTPGYVAPEVWSKSNGPVTDRSDVYSYGMLVMEMVGGRKNFDMKASRSSKIYYPEWAFKQVEMGEFQNLRGDNIADEEDAVIAKKLSMLGLWCIQYNPSQRPSMSKVIQMLEGTVDIAIPPQPLPVDTSVQTAASSSTESSSSL